MDSLAYAQQKLHSLIDAYEQAEELLKELQVLLEKIHNIQSPRGSEMGGSGISEALARIIEMTTGELNNRYAERARLERLERKAGKAEKG